MKKTQVTLALAGLMIASATIVSSCKKKDATTTTTTPDTDQSGASANNQAENISNDIVSMGAQASDNGSLSTFRTENQTQILGLACATVSKDTSAKTITVTFTNTTPCLDGKTRSGSLIYNYSASTNGAKHYRDPGFTLNVTSQNYVVNSNSVTINSKTITNTTAAGFNPLNTNETWSINADLSIALGSGAGTIEWKCNRIKTLLNTGTAYTIGGQSVPAAYTNSSTPINWAGAVIGITGNASGSRSNGETFSVNVTNQLIRSFDCSPTGGGHPFIQGTFTYAPAGKATRTFDYGNGTCDDLATLTINGVTYNIILP